MSHELDPSGDQPGARRRFIEGLAAGATGGALLSLTMKSSLANAQALPTKFVTLKDFGAIGNGTTDDTSAVQNAIDSAASGNYQAIYVTAGTYKITDTITIRRGISLIGEGCEPYKDLGTSSRGNGSWFYLAHTKIGFNIRPDTQSPPPHDLSGFYMKSIGTIRNQPTPGGSAFTPTANDWDIYIANSDVFLEDLTLLNPTKGIYVTNAAATPPNTLNPFSRVTIHNIRGQPLTYGLVIDETRDIARISDIHWWPFWTLNPNVNQWQIANLVGIQLARCDTPFISNVFSWATRIGFKVIANSAGTTTGIQLANANFDNTHIGMYVDASSIGVTGQMTNVTTQGSSPYSPLNAGVQIEGSSCLLDFVNLSSSVFNTNAVLVNGNGNIVNISNFRSRNYDGSGAGYPALQVASGNSAFVTGLSEISYVSTATWFGGSGNISCHLGSGTVSTTTDVSGFAGILPSPSLRCDPRKVFVQMTGTYTPALITVDMQTAGFIRTRFFTPSGTPMANTAVSFHWRAEY